MVLGLRMVIEKAWEYNQRVYFAIIDIQRAFDSVPREKVWGCMKERYSIIGHLKKATKKFYYHCVCSIKTANISVKWFQVKTRVKQGSVLSTLLFIAYMEIVMEDFKKGREEDYRNRIIAYADGIADWSTNREDIIENIKRFGHLSSVHHTIYVALEKGGNIKTTS
ncbi:uncharacterized protein LOC143034830 [Oratosquilla oratoria]|uniref:uncharacterized protein LOC143034830 n=1 Tax=Oratosquilla oratoria TaxID=337810 RepID=UPI003F757D8E